MQVFQLRKNIIEDYAKYINSFVEISDYRIREAVDNELSAGFLWPDPLLQLNPAFAWGGWIDELVQKEVLHPACSTVFQIDKSETNPTGRPMRLYKHQVDAIYAAQTGDNYVLTTGTGSGKSLSYIIPIVDHVLRQGTGKGIKAIIVYPMNALANSQALELQKFLCDEASSLVRVMRYTGQEDEKKRQEIINDPPDILLTNYVMLELILTRPAEKRLISAAGNLQFLVFDELHTYRGRQGADVALLIRRLRNALTPAGASCSFQCIGTSATLVAPGNVEEQKDEVAKVATKLFGVEVMPSKVIVETLRQETHSVNLGSEEFKKLLTNAVLNFNKDSSAPYEKFIRNPLPVWIEKTLGLKDMDGHLVRCKPKTLAEATQNLSETISVDIDICNKAIEKTLLYGYSCKNPDTGKPTFAFKLHQFLSKGDTVYATAEQEDVRFITLYGQQYAPNQNEETLLFPLQFCRECGQEYYSVWRIFEKNTKTEYVIARNHANDTNVEGIAGYLYINTYNPWPEDIEEQFKILPEDWFTEKKGKLAIKKNKEKYLPEKVFIAKNGTLSSYNIKNTTMAWFMPKPFVFCMQCHVSYSSRISDFTKLATLGTEGRSTATSVLSMSTVRHLRQEKDLPRIAQKLLCFTDNRQDASLQAGHFNDFIEIGLVRSALFNALSIASTQGLEHDVLAQKVFLALGLGFKNGIFPPERFSVDPSARFSKEGNIQKAFWQVLGYRIYSDLRRGWRIVAPNLEQCGLLHIEYLDMQEICEDEGIWERNVRLATATTEQRKKVAKMFLDYMRRSLSIKVDYLKRDFQESIRQQSSQHLISPWKIDENETMHYASITFPCAEQKSSRSTSGNKFISPRGALGLWLRREFEQMSVDETGELIKDIFSALSYGGLIEPIIEDVDHGKGYQIPASVMLWKAGDGKHSQTDPLRTKYADTQKGRTNPFFVDLYRAAVKDGISLEAKEHTAQVFSEVREQREKDFRDATLPILYCSPTMELGVDIAQLNAVFMRNVPPTPANYAQRSGRAGRSGQPALIITYCAQGSSHDQYFFKNPVEMVAGAVSTPRIELANEDLIRAHIHALWLSESGLDLRQSLKDLLDVSGDIPSLALLPSIKTHLIDTNTRSKVMLKASLLLEELSQELQESDSAWHAPTWLEDTLMTIEHAFEGACERWRSLYNAAVKQRVQQNAIIGDASKSQKDREQAQRLRNEAETQINLLLQSNSRFQSDFYSYRYFASEGFLPGYNFPRLPLSAYIPGRSSMRRSDEYISRSRFLAISEFGPGSFIYHEGSRYVINRVMLDIQEGEELASGRIKQCNHCGYIHPIQEGGGLELCEICNTRLPIALDNLFRMRNVSTRRRDRINSDEEERTRYGYALCTGFRFAQHGGTPICKLAEIYDGNQKLVVKLRYGHSATLWRINLGWANSSNATPPGFVLDLSKGTWTREGNIGGNSELEEAGNGRARRVIPYVEDRKNCLLFEPQLALDLDQMLTLQMALKQGIQRKYQLEELELAAETLPAGDEPHAILFYESAEGGAGVLRKLVDDPTALGEIAKTTLKLCHFDSITGDNLSNPTNAKEECVVACYDCLLSYGNQRFHKYLNRHKIKDLLLDLLHAQVITAPTNISRAKFLQKLLNRCDSNLEKSWLDTLEKYGYALPTHSQEYIAECNTRPDFFYSKENVAIYIDGPYHEFPEREKRDSEQQLALEDMGVLVLRFAAQEQWEIVFHKYPHIFGNKK